MSKSCGCGCSGTRKDNIVEVSTPDPSIQERADKLGVPIIKPYPKHIKERSVDPNPVVAVCGECGLEVHRVMGYVCTHAHCPCGLGPVMC